MGRFVLQNWLSFFSGYLSAYLHGIVTKSDPLNKLQIVNCFQESAFILKCLSDWEVEKFIESNNNPQTSNYYI